MSDSETTWTVACQAALSMGFLRQEYWGGLPCPFPGDVHDSAIKPGSPALQADSLLLHHWGSYGIQQKQFYSTLLGFSQQVYRGCLPFPPPVDPVLSELFTMTCPSWAALNGLAHGFTELCKPLHHKVVINIPLEKHNSKRLMYPNVHCSTIYKSQDMEAT